MVDWDSKGEVEVEIGWLREKKTSSFDFRPPKRSTLPYPTIPHSTIVHKKNIHNNS